MSKCENCPLSQIPKPCPGENALVICEQIRSGNTNNPYVRLISDFLGGKEITPPNIIKKAINYTSSLYKHWTLGKPAVVESVYQNRLLICKDCDFCDKKSEEEWECKVCGCPLQDKAAWADQNCPLIPPKWDVVTDPNLIVEKIVKGGCCK
jgi:hypothetical protein